jgi:hypothetical protein
MADTTYSFADYNFNIVSPIGTYSVQGKGIGSATVTMATTKSIHSVGADGSVMTSKIAGDNGTIAIQVQQTSGLNTYLTKLYNLLKASPSEVWTSTQFLITNSVQKEVCTCIGCSPENLPEKPMQAEGQMITWTWLCQNIQQVAL